MDSFDDTALPSHMKLIEALFEERHRLHKRTEEVNQQLRAIVDPLTVGRETRVSAEVRAAGGVAKALPLPVVAHGRLFARNGEEMACYELKPAETK